MKNIEETEAAKERLMQARSKARSEQHDDAGEGPNYAGSICASRARTGVWRDAFDPRCLCAAPQGRAAAVSHPPAFCPLVPLHSRLWRRKKAAEGSLGRH